MILAKVQKNMNTVTYKVGFVLVAACFTSTVLLFYSNLLVPIIPPSNLLREYFICFGQIIFQGLILAVLKTKKELILTYIVNMMMVSLLGGLLLLPAFVGLFFNLKFQYGYMIYFLCIALFMFFNHKKRVKNISAPIWLTYTWVLYRCLVLLIIL